MTVKKVPQYETKEFVFHGRDCIVLVRNEEVISESRCTFTYSGITFKFTLGEVKFYDNRLTYLGVVRIKDLPVDIQHYLCQLKCITYDDRFEVSLSSEPF